MKNEENTNDNKKEILKTKIEFFLREKIKCHIDKYDRSWLNGKFLKKFDDDMYLFVDDVLGEQHLSLSELRDVNTFIKPKNKEGGRFKANNF